MVCFAGLISDYKQQSTSRSLIASQLLTLHPLSSPHLYQVSNVRIRHDVFQPAVQFAGYMTFHAPLMRVVLVRRPGSRHWARYAFIVASDTLTFCSTSGEVTSQSLWSRYDRHFVGITSRYNVLSQMAKICRVIRNKIESVIYIPV